MQTGEPPTGTAPVLQPPNPATLAAPSLGIPTPADATPNSPTLSRKQPLQLLPLASISVQTTRKETPPSTAGAAKMPMTDIIPEQLLAETASNPFGTLTSKQDDRPATFSNKHHFENEDIMPFASSIGDHESRILCVNVMHLRGGGIRDALGVADGPNRLSEDSVPPERDPNAPFANTFEADDGLRLAMPKFGIVEHDVASGGCFNALGEFDARHFASFADTSYNGHIHAGPIFMAHLEVMARCQ
ncbi:hypothetical protein LY76DRAFT_688085 [Colletotrichum caudatum]|nr:hypothetical protein LY76DRAFT_688085 [Colletotrichum caudatum]